MIMGMTRFEKLVFEISIGTIVTVSVGVLLFAVLKMCIRIPLLHASLLLHDRQGGQLYCPTSRNTSCGLDDRHRRHVKKSRHRTTAP